jgi:hypothetical protein
MGLNNIDKYDINYLSKNNPGKQPKRSFVENRFRSTNHFNQVIEPDLPIGGCNWGARFSKEAQGRSNETHPYN